MPTESKKKKSKDEKKSLLLIKNEPEDLKSMEHYVDDRIELIKQIFGTLKTKTIESIIPEFLQGKPIEEIQEICLEEVLGISKKRLVSIINATKCPTDTESSDSGSDVEKIEEHISLEEISSDSDDELSKPRKKKKREVKKVIDPVPKPIAPTLPNPAEKNGDGTEKQYSVLELLELQARARAIRSQLALEPVTKIELDDSDTEPVGKDNVKDSAQNNDPAGQLEKSTPPEEDPKVPVPRPVRLKRNFRQRQMEGYESDENQTVTEKEETVVAATELASSEKVDEKSKSPEKSVEPIVPHDDDVVPIIAEPEILCISSSDSENEEKKEKKQPRKVYITMPVIEKEVRPPTEDELFLLKIKEKSAKKRAEASILKDARTSEVNDEAPAKETQSKQPAVETHEIDEEMEDGEIVEDEEVVEIAESPEEPSSEQKGDTNEVEKSDDSERKNETQKDTRRPDKRRNDSSSSESESESDSSRSSDNESDNSDSKEKSQTSKKSVVDDDDDDIIDLGKDEDLEFEINAVEEPEKEVTSSRRTRSKAKTEKSPDRESATTAEPKDESWDKRWLRGNKVSKVLATAKLANKVRSKIKEKKTKTAIAVQKPVEVAPPKEVVPEIPANVEVGSVEHYKELTKQK